MNFFFFFFFRDLKNNKNQNRTTKQNTQNSTRWEGVGGNLQYPHLALRICSLLACVADGWMGRINVLYKMHISELNYSIKIHMYIYYTNSFCIMRKYNNIWEQRTEGLKVDTATGRLSSCVIFYVQLTPTVMGWRWAGRVPCIHVYSGAVEEDNSLKYLYHIEKHTKTTTNPHTATKDGGVLARASLTLVNKYINKTEKIINIFLSVLKKRSDNYLKEPAFSNLLRFFCFVLN